MYKYGIQFFAASTYLFDWLNCLYLQNTSVLSHTLTGFPIDDTIGLCTLELCKVFPGLLHGHIECLVLLFTSVLQSPFEAFVFVDDLCNLKSPRFQTGGSLGLFKENENPHFCINMTVLVKNTQRSVSPSHVLFHLSHLQLFLPLG